MMRPFREVVTSSIQAFHIFQPRTFILILKDLGKKIRTAQLLLIASSLAYTTILSIVPLIALILSMFKAFGGLEKNHDVVRLFFIENLGENSGHEAMLAIQRFIENVHATAIGIPGLLGLILTSMSMLSSIESAINRVWGMPVNRTLFQRLSSYWLFVTLGPIALSVLIAGSSSSSYGQFSHYLPHGLGAFLSGILIFTLIYKGVPNKPVHLISALCAALITTVLWSLAKGSYAVIVKKVLTYNKIYGSLSAIPVFLLWIYILWIIVLTGAALSSVIEKRLEPK